MNTKFQWETDKLTPPKKKNDRFECFRCISIYKCIKLLPKMRWWKCKYVFFRSFGQKTVICTSIGNEKIFKAFKPDIPWKKNVNLSVPMGIILFWNLITKFFILQNLKFFLRLNVFASRWHAMLDREVVALCFHRFISLYHFFWFCGRGHVDI